MAGWWRRARGLLWLKPLDRKLLRDLWHIKGQAFAIAIVIACGVGMYVMSKGMLVSLEETRSASTPVENAGIYSNTSLN